MLFYKIITFNKSYSFYSITYKLKPVLYYEAIGPDLKQYIANKYGLDEDDLESIDWKAHGAAINRTDILHIHITKLVYDILTTNDRVHNFTQTRTDKCQYCHTTV